MTFCPVFILYSKNRFDNLFRKYITYTDGEELFGLPVTHYPQLLDIKKQLILLQKLYGLYNTVIETVNGYYDILWADINIENINNELLDFQTRFLSLSVSRNQIYVVNISTQVGYFTFDCHILQQIGAASCQVQ